MVDSIWLTSECVVEWLLEIMLPERCYQLSAAGRPNRGLRAGSRNSPGWTRAAIVQSRSMTMRTRRGVVPLTRRTTTRS